VHRLDDYVAPPSEEHKISPKLKTKPIDNCEMAAAEEEDTPSGLNTIFSSEKVKGLIDSEDSKGRLNYLFIFSTLMCRMKAMVALEPPSASKLS
jgi:hypothetical protein